ncbi:PREDICTED: serpin-ZX-like [Nicotiana attenuata]|uniref:serpin-ZX-like n=1 Tax=Nicotiana attenuata TaxID=49451 RepID=UPI000904FA7D|nr:PREDICTED: serpin-ZX-like [Nicotiana attenuata]
MFHLRNLFQQHRDVSLKLARHVFFSNFEGHQSVAKVLRGSTWKQTDAFLTLANRVVPTAVHKGESNMIFSPLLMQVVLGLMTAGSAGPSRDELLSFLKSNSTDEINYLSSQLVDYVLLDGTPNGGPRLSAANSVWVDQRASLKPSFTQIVDNVYKATSLSVDFASKVSFLILLPLIR